MYQGQVMQRDGLPCFSVEDNRETRKTPPRLAGLNVASYRDEIAEHVWLRSFPDDSSSDISPANCVVYGDDGKAPALKVGEPYSVAINSFISKGTKRENRSYHAYFCVTETPEGQRIVHQVFRNDSKAGYDWSVCQ